jgi:hypothetical protein
MIQKINITPEEIASIYKLVCKKYIDGGPRIISIEISQVNGLTTINGINDKNEIVRLL